MTLDVQPLNATWTHATSALLALAALSGRAEEGRELLINAIEAYPISETDTPKACEEVFLMANEQLVAASRRWAEELLKLGG